MCKGCEAAKNRAARMAQDPNVDDGQFRDVRANLRRLVFWNHGVSLNYLAIMQRTDFEAGDFKIHELYDPPKAARR